MVQSWKRLVYGEVSRFSHNSPIGKGWRGPGRRQGLKNKRCLRFSGSQERLQAQASTEKKRCLRFLAFQELGLKQRLGEAMSIYTRSRMTTPVFYGMLQEKIEIRAWETLPRKGKAMFTANTRLYFDSERLHAPLDTNKWGFAFVRTYKIGQMGNCRMLIKRSEWSLGKPNQSDIHRL